MSDALGAFGYAFMSGAAALALWDVLHGLRRAFFRGFFGNLVLDTAWWCVSASLFIFSVWSTAQWRIRFFELIALIMGAVLWHMSFSGLLKRFSVWFFGVIREIFIFIFKILLTPARISGKILSGYCKRKRKA